MALDADIYVIQECEDPATCVNSDYHDFAGQYIWTGESKNKGLGIFVKNNIEFSRNNWETYCLRNFISVNVGSAFDLIGVWACYPYIGEYYLSYIKTYSLSNLTRYTLR